MDNFKYDFSGITHRTFVQGGGRKTVICQGGRELCLMVKDSVTLPGNVYAKVERIGHVPIEDIDFAQDVRRIEDVTIKDEVCAPPSLDSGPPEGGTVCDSLGPDPPVPS